jgi:general secretion pathway protein E
LTLGVSTGNPPKIYEPVGCSECSESGYIGRKGIYELVWVDEEMRRLIHEGAGEQAMILHARKHTTSIMEDGVRKILNGETSMEEVLRVTQVD